MRRSSKTARAAIEPSGAKGARGRVTDQDLKSDHSRFAWSLELADYGGKWGFTTEVFRSAWCDKILSKLRHYEGSKWAEIANATGGRSSGTRNHHINVSGIIKDAQKRLGIIEMDDLDQLYSLRLASRMRIYGVVQGRVLKIIWYDPKHEVCPSTPK